MVWMSHTSYSQDWNWPDDREAAELQLVTYMDYFKVGYYRESVSALQWLLENAPDLNPSIYQNGVNIYTQLAAQAEDHQKVALQDSILWMFDQRMVYFWDSVNVMNRKAYAMYKYFHRDSSRYMDLLDQFDATFAVSGNKVLKNNLLAYMIVIKLNQRTFGELTYEQVLDRYNKIHKVIAAKEAAGADLKKQKELIDKVLIETIPEALDCEFVAGKISEAALTAENARSLFALMHNAGCEELPAYLDLARRVNDDQPTFALSRGIGKKYYSVSEHELAETFFLKADSLAASVDERALVRMDLVRLAMTRDDFRGARTYLKQILHENQDHKQALNGLGNLYFYGAATCLERESKVYDRLPYLAAYTYYERAGNEKMLQASQEQFPSMESIFLEDRNVGDTMHVGCWIDEHVTLKARPSI